MYSVLVILEIVGQLNKVSIDLKAIIRKFALSNNPIDEKLFLRIIKDEGFKSKFKKLTLENFSKYFFPAIARYKDDEYVTILKVDTTKELAIIFNNSSNKSLLVQDNTGKSYTYTYNSSSDTFENQTPIATADDAINFIANFDGSMSDLQNIQNAVKDAYENYGLSKEYYDAFMASFNTYVAVHTQNNNVTTQPTGNSTRIDKHAFYYYNNINDTALSLANCQTKC